MINTHKLKLLFIYFFTLPSKYKSRNYYSITRVIAFIFQSLQLVTIINIARDNIFIFARGMQGARGGVPTFIYIYVLKIQDRY